MNNFRKVEQGNDYGKMMLIDPEGRIVTLDESHVYGDDRTFYGDS